MNKRTAKQFHFCVLNEKRLNRQEFAEGLRDITDLDALKLEIMETLEKQGRVYGIYKKKDLVGVYIFERQEDYFSEKKSGIQLGVREFDFDKFWYGNNTAALRLKNTIYSEEVEDSIEKLEKDFRTDLIDQIELGQVAGVEWKDELIYRKNMQEKSSNGFWGGLAGFIIGFGIGGLIYDSIIMKISMGMLYGMMWAGVGIVSAKGPEIGTLDFVQKREVDENATE